MQQVSPLSRAADVLIGGPLRLMAVAAAFQAGSHGLELAYRVLKTVGANVFGALLDIKKKNFMEAVSKEEYRAQKDTKFSYIDIRGKLSRQEPLELAKNGLRYVAIAIVLKEIADRAVGSPILGFNMVGSVLGLQVLSGSIIDNVSVWKNWPQFFQRMPV